jgi:hypothetical protein
MVSEMLGTEESEKMERDQKDTFFSISLLDFLLIFIRF